MIKSIGELDKKIFTVLNDINKNGKLQIDSLDKDGIFAIHESIKRGYLDNIEEWQDGYGDYHFETLEIVQIAGEGLKFIDQHAFFSTAKRKIAVFFKSVIGQIVSIIVALVITYLIYVFGWEK